MGLILVNPPAVPKVIPGVGPESYFSRQRKHLSPEQRYSLPMEHLGLASIEAAANAADVPVVAIDGIARDHADIEQTFADMQVSTRLIGSPHVVGFTNINMFHEVEALARMVRNEWPDAQIVLGGVFGTLNAERVLRGSEFIDYVAIGEGEVSVVELVGRIANGGSVADVPGIASRGGFNQIVQTPQTAVELDSLQWVARGDLRRVLDAGFAASVFTTRGCPYRCTFCGTGAMSATLGREGYRFRSIESVLDEIEWLQREFGVSFISIADDLFLSKHAAIQERCAAFAEGILRRGIDITFMCDARLDAVSDLALMKQLHRAGLRRVFIGLETGSEEQLLAYKKHHLPKTGDAVRTIRSLSGIGIEVIPGTIMFHPEVRPSELLQTLELLEATGYTKPRKLFDRITAYAGTPLYRDYEAKGYLTKDWPIGEWSFQNPAAERVYEGISAFVPPRSDVTFEAAAEHFRSLVAEWAAAKHGAGEDWEGVPIA